MKRLFALLLMLILLLCSLSFTACGKKYVEAHLMCESLEIIHEGGDTIFKFYVTALEGYDVADLDHVRIKFRYERKVGAIFMETRIKNAEIPENARGNPDLQYVTVTIKNKEVMEDSYVPIVWIETRVNPATVGIDEEDEAVKTLPSIFSCILIAIVGFAAAVGILIFSLSLLSDQRAQYIFAFDLLIPLALTIFVFTRWGVARGIIFAVFYLLFVFVTVRAIKNLD